jgi:hypothetical protein
MKILISGSRGWTDAEMIRSLIFFHGDANVEWLVGDARGADAIATQYLGERRGQVRIFKADWRDENGTFDRRAGIRRTLEMLDEMPGLILCFWDGESPGTKFTIDTALRRRLNLQVYFSI